MPIQFTTDGSPGYRRLALWQDIVCDVFVGLDCKSDLGSAFRGSVTQATLGKAVCSDVCSDRQHVFRTPSRIARSDQDFVLIALGNRCVAEAKIDDALKAYAAAGVEIQKPLGSPLDKG